MALPPFNVTQLALPNADVRVLQSDGSLALPWRRCIQQLVAAAGGSGPSIAAIIAELAALALAVAIAQEAAEAAQSTADTALTEADLAQQLAAIALAEDETAPTLGANADVLILLGIAGQDAGGGGGDLEVLEDGVSLTTKAASLDFEGSAVALTVSGDAVTIKVGGFLPLVNGDLPGPVAIADGVGQFIGVPVL